MPYDQETLKLYFANDRFAATSGVELIEAREGFARSRLEIEPRHLNGVGIVHGGVLFTLADFTFAVACNSAGQVAVAVSTNMSFMKATKTGMLFAEAVEISRSRKLSVCTVKVTDESGTLVALFQGTAYIKEELLFP